MTAPWLQDADVTLYHGDVLAVLRELPTGSVDCCVTSPPYWGLRDYGTGAWEGGDEGCDHEPDRTSPSSTLEGGKATQGMARVMPSPCVKCGATRIDQQLGLEPTPEEYVTRMVEVFREVRRVLAPHGTVWLNLGDSYAGSTMNGGPASSSTLVGTHHTARPGARFDSQRDLGGLKPKDLVGIPWRVAFALQADGWYLRSDITWCKPNAMPESVTDRPTKATEMIFLLSKNPRYYYDAEAIRQPHKHDGRQVTQVVGGNGSIQHRDGERWPGSGANARNWWLIPTQPYPNAHFATFPEELARRCIAAGTSERGKCPECGAPWVREVERTPMEIPERTAIKGAGSEATPMVNDGERRRAMNGQEWAKSASVTTLGWKRSCEHDWQLAISPCVVLDPFIGSGTVAHVARKLGRYAIGIDLNESYLGLAARRLQQQSLFAEGVA